MICLAICANCTNLHNNLMLFFRNYSNTDQWTEVSQRWQELSTTHNLMVSSAPFSADKRMQHYAVLIDNWVFIRFLNNLLLTSVLIPLLFSMPQVPACNIVQSSILSIRTSSIYGSIRQVYLFTMNIGNGGNMKEFGRLLLVFDEVCRAES